MSQRSQVANSGSSPIAACSAACSAPGTRARSTPTASSAASSRSYQTARVCSVCRGRSSGTVSSTCRRCAAAGTPPPAWSPSPRRTPPRTGAAFPAGEHGGPRCRPSSGRRSPVRVLGVHQGDAGVEVEVVARRSSRRGAGRPRRGARWRAPSRRRRCRASDRCPPPPRPPARRPSPRMSTRARGPLPGRGPEPAGGRRRSTPSATSSSSTAAAHGPAEHPADVGVGQRQLGRRAGQLRARARRGCAGSSTQPSTGRAEQRVGMVHQVGVQRVVPGDEHHQGLVGRPARPARPAARTTPECPGSRPSPRRPDRRCPRPSSSALVVATPSRSPLASAASSARRSSGR